MKFTKAPASRITSLSALVLPLLFFAGPSTAAVATHQGDTLVAGRQKDRSTDNRAQQVADLLRRARRLEQEKDYAAAATVWEQLAVYPETALAARMHRISI